jgi:uncharacterized membrane protein YbhN (UPF0104 family)
VTSQGGEVAHHEDADTGLPEVPRSVGTGQRRSCSRARRILRVALPLALGGALLFVTVSSGSSVSGAVRAIGRMDRGWLACAVLAEITSFAWLATHMRILAGHPANARRAAPLRIALIMFGLGMVMPAAPAEGVMMAGAALKRRRVDPRRIAVLLGCSQWFNARALFAVASIDAAIAVALGDIPSDYAGGVLGGALFTLAALAATTWLSLRPQVVEVVTSIAIRLSQWRHCPPAQERRERGRAWHRIVLHVTGDRRKRALLMSTTVAAWVCDGLCMFLALRAVGAHLGLEQLLLAYTAGVLAASAPFVPGGLGVVETVTPLVLVHFGVHWPEAVAVVLVYRLLGTFLPALAGLLSVVSLRLQPADIPPAGALMAETTGALPTSAEPRPALGEALVRPTAPGATAAQAAAQASGT